MEKSVGEKQYEYKANAGLVLRADRSGAGNVVSSDVSSLTSSLSRRELQSQFGDRARPTTSRAEIKAQLEADQKREDALRSSTQSRSLRRRSARESRDVLSAYVSTDYRPSNQQNRAVYAVLLEQLQQEVGDVSGGAEVLASYAHEALTILKDRNQTQKAKKTALSQCLGKTSRAPLTEDSFTRLFNVAAKITDFEPATVSEEGAGLGDASMQLNVSVAGLDTGVPGTCAPTTGEESGLGQAVPVLLADEDDALKDQELEDLYGMGGGGGSGLLSDSESDHMDGKDGDMRARRMRSGDDPLGSTSMEHDSGAQDTREGFSRSDKLSEVGARGGRRSQGLDPLDIDAYWVQRQMRDFFPDPTVVQQRAEQVLGILGSTQSHPAAENALVSLLCSESTEHFGFIHTLMRERAKIVYCTRLARAQSDSERQRVIKEMRGAAQTRRILYRLQDVKKLEGAELHEAMIKSLGDSREQKTGSSQHKQREGAGQTGAGADSQELRHWRSRPRSTVDLSQLAASTADRNSGVLLEQKQIELPQGTEIIRQKGLMEVHVPGRAARPFAKDEKLVPVSEMPGWSQAAFKGMSSLNRVQSRVYRKAMYSADNMLICAPTGAGKTNVAMMSVLREIGISRKSNADSLPLEHSLRLDSFKCVYIAPMKSLVQEMVATFSRRLAPYGVSVVELSGDVQVSKRKLADAQIIVSTPEKWDIVTRKTGSAFVDAVRLIIIDEIHLLHDTRGPVLETIVARAIRQVESSQSLVRLVGLSATLPNYEDVAYFLRVRVPKDGVRADQQQQGDGGLFFFDHSFRPVPLQQQFVGIKEKKAYKRNEAMNRVCYNKVMDNAGKHQCLVFVHSRKETVATARYIRDSALEAGELSAFVPDESSDARDELVARAEEIKDFGVKELIPYGFAGHHAGLCKADRAIVEQLFRDGLIQVLVSTATLAWGVNLPAHTVIIKGTQIYNPELGRWVELSPLDVTQMMGRAGRPGHDTFGEGVIITRQEDLQFYLALGNDKLRVESQLISRLADALNAEVVLGEVTSVGEAVQWLGYSYLLVRAARNPKLYGVDVAEMRHEDPDLWQWRADLVHSACALLDRQGLLEYDQRGGRLGPTPLGRVASHFYLSHESMGVYDEHMTPHMTEIDLCRVFAMSAEFKYIVVREAEKLELARLLDQVPIPVKEPMEDPLAKVNVLLQAYISKLSLEGFALVADMVYITQSAGRIMRALFEIAVRRGWAQVANTCLQLSIMVQRRQWSVQSPLRQFSFLPKTALQRIERKGFEWDQLFELEPAAIGELVLQQRLGRLIHQAVHMVPRVELLGQVVPMTRSVLRVDLTLTPDFSYVHTLRRGDREFPVHGASQGFWVVVESADGDAVLHYEYFMLKQEYATEPHHLSFTVPLMDPLPPQYFIRVVSDSWLGCNTVLPISFTKLLVPARFPRPTALLDLVRKPAHGPHSALVKTRPAGSGRSLAASLTGLFDFRSFNGIQTQCFQAVFGSRGHAFVAAPVGCGKTVLAELAICRLLLQAESERSGAAAREQSDDKYPAGHGEVKAVYVSPFPEKADVVFADWSARFGGKRVGLSVGRLQGILASDLATLRTSHLVVGSYTQWDALCRRWQKRKHVRAVRLFIADDLHLLGHQQVQGACMEVVVSRMRFISTQLAQTTHHMRLLGLAAPVATSLDMGMWMGAGKSAVFGFPPSARPVPLALEFRGFDLVHFQARMRAMLKPTLQALRRHVDTGVQGSASHGAAPGNAIVFVPSRGMAREVGARLLVGGPKPARDDGASGWRRVARQSVEDHLRLSVGVTPRWVVEAACSGVGILHAGLPKATQRALVELHQRGAIAVLVADQACLWTMTCGARLVVVLGTEHFDGQQHRYVDYSMPQMLAMVGRSGRMDRDTRSHCLVLCPASKKAYYRKFLTDPLPVESHFADALADHLNAEVVNKRVESLQDAVDYVTWQYFYRRLKQNPNLYGLPGLEHSQLSDFLSEMVEGTVEELHAAGCLNVEDESDLFAINLGLIAEYFQIATATVEIFGASLTDRVGVAGLLEVLCHAREFQAVSVHHRESRALRRLSGRLPLPVVSASSSDDQAGRGPQAMSDEGDRKSAEQHGAGFKNHAHFAQPHVKTHVMLQAHFSRVPLSGQARDDLRALLPDAVRLVHGLVDVVASKGWLQPALSCMHLSQMMVQGVWHRDPELLQLPYFTADMCAQARRCLTEDDQEPVTRVGQIAEMRPGDRGKLLSGLSSAQQDEVAHFCNEFPDCMEVEFRVVAVGTKGSVMRECATRRQADKRHQGREVLHVEVPVGTTRLRLQVYLSRGDDEAEDSDEEEGRAGSGGGSSKAEAKTAANPGHVPAIISARFPSRLLEGWWVMCGDASRNRLLAIKRAVVKAGVVGAGPISAGKPQADLDLPMDALTAGKSLTRHATLYVMCDGYKGLDVEFPLHLDLSKTVSLEDEGASGDSDSGSSGSDSDSDSSSGSGSGSGSDSD